MFQSKKQNLSLDASVYWMRLKMDNVYVLSFFNKLDQEQSLKRFLRGLSQARNWSWLASLAWSANLPHSWLAFLKHPENPIESKSLLVSNTCSDDAQSDSFPSPWIVEAAGDPWLRLEPESSWSKLCWLAVFRVWKWSKMSLTYNNESTA